MNSRTLFWLLSVGGVILDQVVKYSVRASLAEHESRTLIPRVVDLTLTYNRGIAFGMFQGAGVLLAPIAIAIAIGAYLYVRKNPHETRLMHSAMGLLVAGALGNLYDRLMFHRVTDMIAVRFVDFPVFNIADTCITIAGTILVISWMKEAVDPKHDEAKDPEQSPIGESIETPPRETELS